MRSVQRLIGETGTPACQQTITWGSSTFGDSGKINLCLKIKITNSRNFFLSNENFGEGAEGWKIERETAAERKFRWKLSSKTRHFNNDRSFTRVNGIDRHNVYKRKLRAYCGYSKTVKDKVTVLFGLTFNIKFQKIHKRWIIALNWRIKTFQSSTNISVNKLTKINWHFHCVTAENSVFFFCLEKYIA